MRVKSKLLRVRNTQNKQDGGEKSDQGADKKQREKAWWVDFTLKVSDDF